jgi:hypothetical protein
MDNKSSLGFYFYLSPNCRSQFFFFFQNFFPLQHMLSLPMFAFMPMSVRRGFVGLSRPSKINFDGAAVTSSSSSAIHPYAVLALNLVTQLICVSGVNQLSSVSGASILTLSCAQAYSTVHNTNHTTPCLSGPPLCTRALLPCRTTKDPRCLIGIDARLPIQQLIASF